MVAGETIFAKPLGGDRYEIDNIPFFAYDVALRDVVEAKRGADGALAAQRVVERRGHSTFRLLLAPTTGLAWSSPTARLKHLRDLGCRYERGMPDGNLIALDIPPKVDLAMVRTIAEEGMDAGAWSYEEAHASDDPGDLET